MVKLDAKVTPEVIMVQYLDELAGRLKDIHDTEERTRPQGLLQEFAYNVDHEIEVRCTPPWFSFTVFNDGPAAIVVDVNRLIPVNPFRAPLYDGDRLTIDFKEAKILKVFLQPFVAGANGNVRVYAVW